MWPVFLVVVLFALTEALKSTKCGVPDNIDSLPIYAQEEIRDIWKTWRRGTACDKELLVQNDVLGVLASLESELGNEAGNSSGGSKTVVNDYEDQAFKPEPVSSSTAGKGRSSSSKFTSNTDADYLDQTTIDDVAMMQFDNVGRAPFLKSASPNVKAQFEKIWNDDNIPSEGLRTHKIQTLAVSVLTSKQLEDYNTWATKRRRVLKAREQEMRGLSKAARRVLRRMSRPQHDQPLRVHPIIRRELQEFAEELNRRRTKKLFRFLF